MLQKIQTNLNTQKKINECVFSSLVVLIVCVFFFILFFFLGHTKFTILPINNKLERLNLYYRLLHYIQQIQLRCKWNIH